MPNTIARANMAKAFDVGLDSPEIFEELMYAQYEDHTDKHDTCNPATTSDPYLFSYPVLLFVPSAAVDRIHIFRAH